MGAEREELDLDHQELLQCSDCGSLRWTTHAELVECDEPLRCTTLRGGIGCTYVCRGEMRVVPLPVSLPAPPPHLPPNQDGEVATIATVTLRTVGKPHHLRDLLRTLAREVELQLPAGCTVQDAEGNVVDPEWPKE